jgi:hypothetical protein
MDGQFETFEQMGEAEYFPPTNVPDFMLLFCHDRFLSLSKGLDRLFPLPCGAASL